jgi:hypothetical protein
MYWPSRSKLIDLVNTQEKSCDSRSLKVNAGNSGLMLYASSFRYNSLQAGVRFQIDGVFSEINCANLG